MSAQLTDAEFLRLIGRLIRNGAGILDTSADRLDAIAQMLDGVERAARPSLAQLAARVEALESARPAPTSSPPPEFSLPPVDPLEAITPTYQPDVPPSPPAQEGL